MSGYLQRIASGAIRPGGSIRPVAGSIYAGPVLRAGSDPLAPGPDLLSADPSEMDARPAAGPGREGRAPDPARSADDGAPSPAGKAVAPRPAPDPQTGPPERKRGEDGQARGPRAAAAPQDLVPRKPATEQGADAGRRPGRSGERREPEAREGRPNPPEAGPPPEIIAFPMEGKGGAGASEVVRERPREDRERPFAPLVAGEFPGGAPPGASPSRPAESHGPGRGRERAGPARVPGPATREPDEIQIHIGRIEVTAAPPPAPRPAQKPQRRAPSLDDYLKRRNAGIR